MAETLEVTVQDQAQPRGFLEMISQASRDPSVSVEKLERLMAMKERYDSIQAEVEFKAAFSRVQEKMPTITKHGRIMVKGQVRSTYAPYDDIDKEIRPIYTAEGFSLSFDSQFTPNPHSATAPGSLTITVKINHRLGHSETRSVALPIDRNEYRTGVQDLKSTVSFGMRVATIMLFNIITVDEDNDGQNKTEPITTEQKNQILDLIMDRNADEAKFCKYMDVQKVDEITQDRFQMAINALQNKGRR